MFLQKELPAQLANTMREVNLLMGNNWPSVCLVQSWYRHSFLELLKYENKSTENPQVLHNFIQVLIKITNRNNNVVPIMVHGVIECKGKYGFQQQVRANIFWIGFIPTVSLSTCILTGTHFCLVVILTLLILNTQEILIPPVMWLIQ